jgi:hypothetical protein
MTSEGLGEMFEGDSADTGAGKFPLVSMGAERRVSRAQTREQGPPSALAEIYNNKINMHNLSACLKYI